MPSSVCGAFTHVTAFIGSPCGSEALCPLDHEPAKAEILTDSPRVFPKTRKPVSHSCCPCDPALHWFKPNVCLAAYTIRLLLILWWQIEKKGDKGRHAYNLAVSLQNNLILRSGYNVYF